MATKTNDPFVDLRNYSARRKLSTDEEDGDDRHKKGRISNSARSLDDEMFMDRMITAFTDIRMQDLLASAFDRSTTTKEMRSDIDTLQKKDGDKEK